MWGSLLIERELFYVLLIFVPLKKNEKIEKKKKRKNICDEINLPKKRNKKREKNKNKIK